MVNTSSHPKVQKNVSALPCFAMYSYKICQTLEDSITKVLLLRNNLNSTTAHNAVIEIEMLVTIFLTVNCRHGAEHTNQNQCKYRCHGNLNQCVPRNVQIAIGGEQSGMSMRTSDGPAISHAPSTCFRVRNVLKGRCISVRAFLNRTSMVEWRHDIGQAPNNSSLQYRSGGASWDTSPTGPFHFAFCTDWHVWDVSVFLQFTESQTGSSGAARAAWTSLATASWSSASPVTTSCTVRCSTTLGTPCSWATTRSSTRCPYCAASVAW